MAHSKFDRHLIDSGAAIIFEEFTRYQGRFQSVTQRAKHRFAQRDWPGMQADATERLSLYGNQIHETEGKIRRLLGDAIRNRNIWSEMKSVYARSTGTQDDWNLAGTYFNSLTRRIFTTIGVDSQIEFSGADFSRKDSPASKSDVKRYGGAAGTAELIERILLDQETVFHFHDIHRDAHRVARELETRLPNGGASTVIGGVQIVKTPFFRGMGAYLIGCLENESGITPLVLSLLHDDFEGVYVDAVLLCESEVSILLSFTRTYFHVEMTRPSGLVRFLKKLIPRKPAAELYNAIGYEKHGKTVLYQDLRDHLSACGGDQFEIARGKPGMVMEVFTMPSYDVVFKIIKDRFTAPKRTTRRDVMEKYDLVFHHDRAGRLVEAQSFEFLHMERCGFTDRLVAQLQQIAADTIQIEGEHIIVNQVYVERRVTPLDIYLEEADLPRALAVVVDFGSCIKDLARSNIFPGDLLLKNFGVTRHDRVVFYDYDEICFITDCRFRKIPKARSIMDEMASEAWYLVDDADVFPEEFKQFFGLSDPLMVEFMAHHSDLFSTDFWIRTQAAIQAGQPVHIFPYPQNRRLTSMKPSAAK